MAEKQNKKRRVAAAAAADKAAVQTPRAGAAKPVAAASAASAAADKQPGKRLDKRFVAAGDPRFAVSSTARQQQQQHRDIQLARRKQQFAAAGRDTISQGAPAGIPSKRQAKAEEAREAEERAARAEGGLAAAKEERQRLLLDSRFSRILTEPSFLTGKGLGSSKIDKFGRQKTEKKDRKGDSKGDKGSDACNASLPSERLAAEIARRELLGLYALPEGEKNEEAETPKAIRDTAAAAAAAAASSSSSSSSDSSSDSSSEEEEEGEEELWDTTADAPLSEDVSARLAVVGLDWDSVNATALLLLMQQFARQKPEEAEGGSRVRRVQIYFSDFGKERVEQEKIKGPAVEWSRVEKRRRGKSRGPAAAAAAAAAAPKFSQVDFEGSGSSDDEQQASPEEEKAVQEVLRKYQVERSRYYYAVVETDSAATAQHLYDELDGCDFGFALSGIDLRFIPEEMQLPAANLVAEADSSSINPAAAAAAAERLELAGARSSSALRHCKVQLTWDETPKEKTKFLRRKFTAKELDEQDLEAFLASSSESAVEEQTERTEKNTKNAKLKEIKEPRRWKLTEENLAAYRQQLLGDLAEETDPSGSEGGADFPSQKSSGLRVSFKKSLEALASDSEEETAHAAPDTRWARPLANLRKGKPQDRRRAEAEEAEGVQRACAAHADTWPSSACTGSSQKKKRRTSPSLPLFLHEEEAPSLKQKQQPANATEDCLLSDSEIRQFDFREERQRQKKLKKTKASARQKGEKERDRETVQQAGFTV